MNEDQKEKKGIFSKPWVQSVIGIAVVFGALGSFLFWQNGRGVIQIDNSMLSAPVINLSATAPGVLNALYVTEGQNVSANSQVALVGSQIITTQTSGVVASAPMVLGAYFNSGQIIASIINVNEMKVVGQVEETKGLKDIMKGQRAAFSVDAFPGKTFEGIVDEISPTSNDTGVAFSISDKRPIKKFDIKVRFDASKFPELKNGMSAKIKVYTGK